MALSKLNPELLNHLADFAYEDAPGPVRRRVVGEKAPPKLMPSSPAPLAAECERVNRACAKMLYPRLVKTAQMDHEATNVFPHRSVPRHVPAL